jgi:hypothetical protein
MVLFRHERSWNSDPGEMHMVLTVREHNPSGCRLRSHRVTGDGTLVPLGFGNRHSIRSSNSRD